MAEKGTTMVLKVDLQCPRCYRKIKKLLCKFPEIRDQIYDEKQNTVTITVFCCSPERIRQKLCCKGGKIIKSIEIKEPEKPKPKPADPKPAEKPPEKPPPKEVPAAPKPEPPKTPAPKPPEPAPKPPEPAPKAPEPAPKPPEPAPKAPEPAPKPPQPAPKAPAPAPPKKPEPVPVPGYPTPIYPRGICCKECYEGYQHGPCYHRYGRPAPPPPCYEPYGMPCYCGCGGRRVCASRCDYYFSEENPSACTAM